MNNHTTIILNEKNADLLLIRVIKKETARSIHTTHGEVLQFKDGWRQATNTEKMRMDRDDLVR